MVDARDGEYDGGGIDLECVVVGVGAGSKEWWERRSMRRDEMG